MQKWQEIHFYKPQYPDIFLLLSHCNAVIWILKNHRQAVLNKKNHIWMWFFINEIYLTVPVVLVFHLICALQTNNICWPHFILLLPPVLLKTPVDMEGVGWQWVHSFHSIFYSRMIFFWECLLLPGLLCQCDQPVVWQWMSGIPVELADPMGTPLLWNCSGCWLVYLEICLCSVKGFSQPSLSPAV